MRITLKAGAILTSGNGHHGLTLAQWYALEAGQTVEVEEVAASLEPLVDVTQDEEHPDGN